MNCPSRVDETLEHHGWNQSPPALAADATTRQDLNGLANSRRHRHHKNGYGIDPVHDEEPRKSWMSGMADDPADADSNASAKGVNRCASEVPLPLSNQPQSRTTSVHLAARQSLQQLGPDGSSSHRRRYTRITNRLRHLWGLATKFAKFIGPGFMISVAYIDPGNYSTDVAAGASFRFRLLFIVLLANLFAIFLQSLCIKLGTVTGLNLAEHCRAHLPRWLNISLYLFAEAAIIATDIAEVSFVRAQGHLVYRLMV